MGERTTMTRAEAARLLGVREDAGPDDVRHAWRMWARMAHPDAGGDSEHFAALDRARRVMLTSASSSPAAASPGSGRPDRPAPEPTPARLPLNAVMRSPRHPAALTIGATLAILCAAAPAALGLAPGTVGFATAALPATVGAAAWAWWAARALLMPSADRGHRIAVLTLAWLAVDSAQQVVSALTGASLLAVLPLLALPLAAAVGVINVGAGLWRPINAPYR